MMTTVRQRGARFVPIERPVWAFAGRAFRAVTANPIRTSASFARARPRASVGFADVAPRGAGVAFRDG